MLSILSVLPIVGPIIQGVVDIFNKKADVDLQKTVDANKTSLGKQVDANKTDVSIIQTRAGILLAYKDDLGLKLMRDVIIYPVAVWNLLFYYNLTFKGLIPDHVWDVGTPPDAMQYIPYAVIAYLFATAYKGRS